MAAASLIVFSSSSPNLYQLPPITPPSVQEKSKILISSSPGLLSPSCFVKPRPSGLKIGSRAQQAPDGAQIGFASAGSLWKVDGLEIEKRRNQDRATEDPEPKTKASTGKLVKPKNAERRQIDGEPALKKQKLDEYAYLEPDESALKKRKTEAAIRPTATQSIARHGRGPKTTSAITEYALDAPASVEDNACLREKATRKPKKAVKKSPKLDDVVAGVPVQQIQDGDRSQISAPNPTTRSADYALEAFPQTNSIQNTGQRANQERQEAPKDGVQIAAADHDPLKAPAQGLTGEPNNAIALGESAKRKSKKPRKKVSSAVIADGEAIEAPVKKPRKRKKSESIILNSDEPELFNPTATTSNYFKAAPCDVTDTIENLTRSMTADISIVDRAAAESVTIARHIENKPMKTGQISQLDCEKGVTPLTDKKQSYYFSNANTKGSLEAETFRAEPTKRDGSIMTPAENGVAAGVSLPAPSKRRDWTPVKDNVQLDSIGRCPSTADSEPSTGPQRQLMEILGGFGYVSNDAETIISERSAAGEAITKRTRIELGPAVGIGSGSRSEEQLAEPSPPKAAKQKKGRKKAQTITALATAAFQPPKENNTDEATMSLFFSPTTHDSRSKELNTEQAKPAKAKSTKARRPRKPKDNDNLNAKNARPKKASKAKKPKVKFNEADYRSKLYSPARATALFKVQNILFATSSQLAMDEPASFIRDMQVAIQQSELVPMIEADGAPLFSQGLFSQAQHSPQGKSCAKVPTAPHGTCLSIEQARRELWCVSSRDLAGGVLKSEGVPAVEARDDPEEQIGCGLAPLPGHVSERAGADFVAKEVHAAPATVVVDLCNTSPIAIPDHAGPALESGQDLPLEQQEADRDQSLQLHQHAEGSDDWMFLESSSPLQASVAVAVSATDHNPLYHSDAKLLSPRRFRTPLSPLNANTMIATVWPREKAIPSRQIRPLSYTAVEQDRKSRSKSPVKKGPGRPLKKTATTNISPSPSKRRGRPPKTKTLESDPSQLPKPKNQIKSVSASQPNEQTDFIDIDDIIDPDSPTTPSPPRRRATSSPPIVQPLTLSPSIQAKAPAAAVPALKAKDSHWTTIRTDLFSRIFAVITSTPRSNDASRPTWYEKILLYDPIVLEDLTAWVNEQGLRVEVKKPKPKAKKRGRKKKATEATEEVVEWEVEREHVQAWMVQKFCEEKSICCLWKEGLRGGVRTRY